MAGALVGGAVLSAFLQVAFERVASCEVLDYLKGRRLIDELVHKLKIQLISADAVIIDAEEKQFTYPAIKMWLDELKDAVYVADDLLDDIAYEALRCKFESESTNKVMSFISTFVNSFDKRIQSELEKILGRLEYITKQKDALGLKEVASGIPSRQLTTSCPEVDGVYGRDVDKEEIFKLLQSNESSGHDICVVPIVGMGGVGKTTLAQLVYNYKRVKESFDYTTWNCVSENFDIFRILKTVFEQVIATTCDIQDLNFLQVKIRERFEGKKVFVVLDDVWNEKYNVWDDLLRIFRCGAREIKIIVTTRSENVALVVGTVPTHYLKQLSDEECWLLFAKHAFKNGNSYEYSDLEVIGKGIVHKCKGLPLAAKTLGGLLRSKEDPREWEKILKSDMWDLPEGKSDILPTLRLSYHYLSSHLKRCFAYCSILPKDYEFRKEDLVLLWMAEDLLQQCKGNARMEEIGEWYFDDLVSRSFFLRSSKNESYFVMHDLVNDLAKFIAGEFCFRLEMKESCEVARKTRHLSYVRAKFDSSKKFKLSREAKCLRTFLAIDLTSSWFQYNLTMIDNLLLSSKCLRVLSLSDFQNIRELPDSIGNLKHLRYLNLNYTSIEQLPDSVCTLYNLQTLLLRCCMSLTRLPSNMRRLVNLRHLDISGTSLKEMSLQMGQLRNLQKLNTFVVGTHNGCSIKELGELQHLYGALSILNLQNVQHARDATEVKLKDKQCLSELMFRWSHGNDNSENERVVLEQLHPHTKLESLIIENYRGTRFPNWLGDCSFSNMVSIRLVNCKYCFSLPPLGHLPVLKLLFVQGFCAMSHVDAEFYGNGSFAIKPFISLEMLSFTDMREWQEWFLFEGESEGGVFSALRELSIINCPKLSKDLPNQLSSLTTLEIRHCQQLVTSLPNAPALHRLHLSDCDKILLKELPPRLRWLEIGGCQIPQSFVDLMTSLPTVTLKSLEIHGTVQLPKGHYYPSLERLLIWDYCDSLWSFPLEFYPKLESLYVNKSENLESLSASEESHWDFTSLTNLQIWDCPNFVSFPSRGLCAPNLTKIRISICNKLKSLPKGMRTLLPSLVKMQLIKCPELESFPEGGLPSNLVSLQIINCDKLFSRRMEWGLQALHSLREFTILSECKEVESFPEEALLPPTLTDFYISSPNLKSLNAKGFQHLTSLKCLNIEYCKNLQFLPEEGLPTSLSKLILQECPLLEQRCQREKGKDWPKIAHICFIKINQEVITS